jgi:hypothetical protein
MQALVPTDIDVEDKILGPFTVKQSIYLLIGAMSVAILYFIFANIFYLFIILALPVILLTGAFVFYKFNEQPFEKFLIILVNYFFNPRKRLWQREAETPFLIIEEERREEIPAGLREEAKKKSITDIDKLAYILDSRGWEKTK